MSRTTGKIKTVWLRLASKEYREGYVASKIANNLAFQVYALREGRGWTQGELAEKAGTKQPAISRLERAIGSVSVSTLKKLAAAFDVGLSIKFVPVSQLVDEATTERLDRPVASFADDQIPGKFAPLFATISAASTGSRLNLAPPSTPWQHATLAAQSQPLVQENVRAN
jgi:HTH-type transcriptional regulator / antitoxin HipB